MFLICWLRCQLFPSVVNCLKEMRFVFFSLRLFCASRCNLMFLVHVLLTDRSHHWTTLFTVAAGEVTPHLSIFCSLRFQLFIVLLLLSCSLCLYWIVCLKIFIDSGWRPNSLHAAALDAVLVMQSTLLQKRLSWLILVSFVKLSFLKGRSCTQTWHPNSVVGLINVSKSFR